MSQGRPLDCHTPNCEKSRENTGKESQLIESDN